jgi:hypothetical protein
MSTQAAEIKASEIRKGDVINLIHEVISVRPHKDMGYLVVKTVTFDRYGHATAKGRLLLYPDETVMRSTAAA